MRVMQPVRPPKKCAAAVIERGFHPELRAGLGVVGGEQKRPGKPEPAPMTAQQYLLSQAEHCRRSASDQADPFVAEALRQLAEEFERKAENELPRPPARPM